MRDDLINRLFKLLIVVALAYALYLGGDFVYSRYWPKEDARANTLIKQYVSKLKNNPNDVATRSQLGQVYLSLERYDEAAKQFEQALQVVEDYGPARIGLAISFMRNGDKEKALKQFKTEISLASKGRQAKIDRFLEQAYYFSGLIYLEKDVYNKAISNFNKALEISNTASDTYFYLGEAYEKSGNSKEARESYKKALDFDPGYERAKEALKNLDG